MGKDLKKCDPATGATCQWADESVGLQGTREGLTWANLVDRKTFKRVCDIMLLYRTKKAGGPCGIAFCPFCGADIRQGYVITPEQQNEEL